MSKSKGNVLDPIDSDRWHRPGNPGQKNAPPALMQPEMASKDRKGRHDKNSRKAYQAFGTDASDDSLLPLLASAPAATSNSICNRTEGYRNFCNKLWNAARYVLMNAPKVKTAVRMAEQLDLSLTDQLDHLSRLQHN